MSDANVRIPVVVRDRLAAIAAEEGLSLRAYLAQLAKTLPTPVERADRAAKTKTALNIRTGHVSGDAEEADLDAELDRRIARTQRP